MSMFPYIFSCFHTWMFCADASTNTYYSDPWSSNISCCIGPTSSLCKHWHPRHQKFPPCTSLGKIGSSLQRCASRSWHAHAVQSWSHAKARWPFHASWLHSSDCAAEPKGELVTFSDGVTRFSPWEWQRASFMHEQPRDVIHLLPQICALQATCHVTKYWRNLLASYKHCCENNHAEDKTSFVAFFIFFQHL